MLAANSVKDYSQIRRLVDLSWSSGPSSWFLYSAVILLQLPSGWIPQNSCLQPRNSPHTHTKLPANRTQWRHETIQSKDKGDPKGEETERHRGRGRWFSSLTQTHTHTNINSRRVSAGFQSAHGFRVSLVSAYSSTVGSRLLIERAVRRRKRRHAAVRENTCCRRQPLIFGSWLYPSRNAAQTTSNNCTLLYVFLSCSKGKYFSFHQVSSNCGERRWRHGNE